MVDNGHQGNVSFLSESVIKNNSNKVLKKEGWELFMNFVHGRKVLSRDSGQLSIQKINGDFHKIVPSDNFKGLKPSEEIKFTVFADAWEIKESNGPRGLFFVFEEDVVTSEPEQVTDYKVIPFTNNKQIKRTNLNKVESTPEAVYEENKSLIKFHKELKEKLFPNLLRKFME